jgi:hypothetical protein
MSKVTDSQADQDLVKAPDLTELDLLKLRADQLGVKYHHKIGAVKLSKMIDAELAVEDKPTSLTSSNTPISDPKTPGENRVALSKEANKLVRVRVANMNPTKKSYPGEIYTVANSVVGTIRKYVPFNNEEGYHVPQMMLNMMQEKECQIWVKKKQPNGIEVTRPKLIKELNVEIMPALSLIELQELAATQAASHSLADM